MIEYEESPMLDIGSALKAAGHKIFQFTGRSRRSEYWWTFLVVSLANFVLTPFGAFVLSLFMIPLTFRRLHDTGRSGWWYGGLLLSYLVFAVVVGVDVLSLALSAGELESCGPVYAFALLGKYLFLVILIVVYKIVLIVMLCLDSDYEPNRYGESPKYSMGTGCGQDGVHDDMA